MGILQIIIISRAVQVCQHHREIIILAIIGPTRLNTCDLGNCTGPIRRLKRTGQQIFFLMGLLQSRE